VTFAYNKSRRQYYINKIVIDLTVKNLLFNDVQLRSNDGLLCDCVNKNYDSLYPKIRHEITVIVD
jgi:hypothetical protein